MNTHQLQYAWAAGFIDGEGTISIKRFFRYRKDKSRYIYYQPFVSLSQAVVGGHEKGVFKLQELFGGGLGHWQDKRPGSNRYKTIQWSVVSLDALNCIQSIYPYLVAKQANADLIIRFFEEREKLKGGSGKVKMTEQEIKKRENLFNQSRLLNQKGKLHLQRLSEITPIGDATV